MAMLARLNSSRTGFTGFLAFQKHCTSVPVQASAIVSPTLIWLTPSRMSRKFTDIVPLMPGRFTLKPETRMHTRRLQRNRSNSSECQPMMARNTAHVPPARVSPMYSFAGNRISASVDRIGCRGDQRPGAAGARLAYALRGPRGLRCGMLHAVGLQPPDQCPPRDPQH